jgi:hypothetical protein
MIQFANLIFHMNLRGGSGDEPQALGHHLQAAKSGRFTGALRSVLNERCRNGKMQPSSIERRYLLNKDPRLGDVVKKWRLSQQMRRRKLDFFPTAPIYYYER